MPRHMTKSFNLASLPGESPQAIKSLSRMYAGKVLGEASSYGVTAQGDHAQESRW